MTNSFQVQRVTKAQDSDFIITIQLGGQTLTMRMTGEHWSKALGSQEPAQVEAFKLAARDHSA